MPISPEHSPERHNRANTFPITDKIASQAYGIILNDATGAEANIALPDLFKTQKELANVLNRKVANSLTEDTNLGFRQGVTQAWLALMVMRQNSSTGELPEISRKSAEETFEEIRNNYEEHKAKFIITERALSERLRQLWNTTPNKQYHWLGALVTVNSLKKALGDQQAKEKMTAEELKEMEFGVWFNSAWNEPSNESSDISNSETKSDITSGTESDNAMGYSDHKTDDTA